MVVFAWPIFASSNKRTSLGVSSSFQVYARKVSQVRHTARLMNSGSGAHMSTHRVTMVINNVTTGSECRYVEHDTGKRNPTER